jgi:hypothetical protein
MSHAWSTLLALGVLPFVACHGGHKPPERDSGGGSEEGGEDGGTDGVSAPCDVPVQVEVGTGSSAFEPLAAGSAVTMVHGPQGGWHMLGSLRAVGFEYIVSVVYTIEHVPSGVRVSNNVYRVGMLYDEPTCTGEYPGMYGYLSVTELVDGELDTPPELMADDPLRLCLAVDDGTKQGEGCLDVVAALDPLDAG